MPNDYEDARLKMPVKLVKRFGNWNCVITEQEDDDTRTTWKFALVPIVNYSNVPQMSGVAPTLEAAKAILEHALTDFDLKSE